MQRAIRSGYGVRIPFLAVSDSRSNLSPSWCCISSFWINKQVMYQPHPCYTLTHYIGWLFGIVVNVLVSINEVNLCRARLVLGWVTMSRVQLPMRENLPQSPRSTQPGHPSMGSTMSTSQRPVMPCGWGVKVWFVSGWQVKLCDLLLPWAISEHL